MAKEKGERGSELEAGERRGEEGEYLPLFLEGIEEEVAQGRLQEPKGTREFEAIEI